MALAYIGIGSNLGEPVSNVNESLARMAELGRVTVVSSYYKTKPWGVTDQPDFINAVCRLETELAPGDLVRALKQLEKAMGRTDIYRWGPRLIDLDVLTYDDISHSEPGVIIPHPGLYERATVLVPLAEIDSSYCAARDRLDAHVLAGVQLFPG
jgi:2-amino-4-hydroxy-6-hydroxymethyldihydropteridine diphosphokinase